MDTELLEVHSMEEALDTFVGKKGTPVRKKYEADLFAAKVGDLIRYHRKKQRMTHDQLGKLIGVSAQKVISFENGKGLNLSKLSRIIQELDGQMNICIKLNREEKEIRLRQ